LKSLNTQVYILRILLLICSHRFRRN